MIFWSSVTSSSSAVKTNQGLCTMPSCPTIYFNNPGRS